MFRALPTLRLLAVLLASYGSAACLAFRWDRTLVVYPRHGMIERGQAQGLDLGEGGSQNIRRDGEGIDIAYGFMNFDRSPLSIHLVLDASAVASEYENYGYFQKDLAALAAWRQKAVDQAYQRVVAQGGDQAAVNAAAEEVGRQYHLKLKAYLHQHEFRFADAKTVEVDVPEVVRRSRKTMLPLARMFAKIGQEHGYDDATVVSAVTAMVQTAVAYQQPPDVDGAGRHIGGFLPPLNVLAGGHGNCNSKSCLLASILTNWSNIRMIGVLLPTHYLTGILRIPQKGDVMVEYGGANYVLVEPAGPAWLPPGMIGDGTQAMLDAHEDLQLEPLFDPEAS